MNKILLILITSTFALPLMGMEEETKQQSPAYTLQAGNGAPFYQPHNTTTEYPQHGNAGYLPQATTNPPVATSMQNDELIRVLARYATARTARTRLFQNPQQGAAPWCQTDYNRERDSCCLQCGGIIFLMPGLCSIGLVIDTILAPCVWQNRKDNPEGAQGRHHYCFMMRRLFKGSTGIASIEIHGDQSEFALFGPSCKIDCDIPAWDSTDPSF